MNDANKKVREHITKLYNYVSELAWEGSDVVRDGHFDRDHTEWEAYCEQAEQAFIDGVRWGKSRMTTIAYTGVDPEAAELLEIRQTCKHEKVVPYGDGDYGVCQECGDNSFPLRQPWPEELIRELVPEIARFARDYDLHTATLRDVTSFIHRLRRIIQDFEIEDTDQKEQS
jgi:hypothetical protein